MKSAGEILGWAKSNLPKMQVLQQDPTKDAMFKSINGQLMAFMRGIVDNCVASTEAVDVAVIGVSQDHVAKVSMPPIKGQRAVKFVLERGLSKPR